MSPLPQQTIETDPSELWIARCPVPTATGVVLDQKWLEREFGPEGFTFAPLRESTDPRVKGDLVHHRLRGLFREGGNVPAFWGQANGLRDTALIGLTWVDEKQVLLARPDSPIQDISDLKGKRFGLSNSAKPSTDIWRAMALHGYVHVLGLAGLTTDDVTLVDLEADDDRPADRQQGGTWSAATERALLNGEVDVIYAKGAPAEFLRAKHNLKVVFDINDHPDPKIRINNGTPRPVTVHRDLLKARPDVVARYLAILLRAADWAELNPEDVVRIVANETRTNAESVRISYGPELHRRLRVTLKPDWLEAFRIQKDFLRDRKLIPGDVDIEAWLDPEPLAVATRLLKSGGLRADPLVAA